MNYQDWFLLFKEQIIHTPLLVWIATGFGVSEVLLAKRNNVLLYPTGIISILLGMYILLNAKLYAEMALNFYYLVMSVYGWAIWKKRKQEAENQVSWGAGKDLIIAVLISAVGFAIFYFVLKNHTDSDVPILDAFVSSTAWAGMWLLAKRKIENWIFLNISNLVAIPLLIHKNLALLSVLTLILFVVAIFGFIDWKKIIDKRKVVVVG